MLTGLRLWKLLEEFLELRLWRFGGEFTGLRLRGLEFCLKAPEVLMAPLGDTVSQGLVHTGVV